MEEEIDTQSVAVGDMDGDGLLDIAIRNDNQGNQLLINNGNYGFTDTTLTVDILNTRSVAVGDVDGDGDMDIVI